ncbi:glutamine-tRNA ligase [Vittaforma corneae ATCC 50505]|uniref:Probable glutamate--tRNA ligase, cytoplasmic n=1 Tax=Vittaforma corneae (strain ATCC 50505) TaxID=993615 RepID=L2GQ25_VITCO|nr:glutamine-tRNA ligase [Vittaforma corneae ATCC 50505]ELA42946.1 glutamine-tRNA ligase [Vittaforma corneae ATCC 50505]
MSENVAKAQLLNFILNKKYGAKEQSNPIIENQIKALNAPGCLLGFRSDFTVDELNHWLAELESIFPIQEEILQDLIFGMLYGSEVFQKLAKAKDFKFASISKLYKSRFETNRKYLAEFNSKDQGKINIHAPKRIVTRFPPEPSGYLHIGHAKAAFLNQYMAKDGKLLVRFDDTNPEKETLEFENAILEDLELLKISDFKLSHSSDYFDVIFEYACQLVKEGKAYVDNTELETMRQQRTDGVASRNRDLDPETSLKIFRAMKDGKYKDYCLRAKISIDNPNKAMRDPVIYRHVETAHHYAGNKYRIYPTYDFTVPILDSIEGVTLALRTNEYRDRNAQYYWFIDNLRLENRPKIHDFSRLNFENTVISKRKMKYYVEKGYVTGWDDPRMCTLRGLARLGMDMGALREYIVQQGASQKTAVVSWDKIWALNKKVIDPRSPRHSAVPLMDYVVCYIDTCPECNIGHPHCLDKSDRYIEIPKHKKHSDLGNKQLLLSTEILLSQADASVLKINEEFTLMNWGNAIVTDKAAENGKIRSLRIKLNLNGDFKTTENKITWIARKGAVMVKFYEYGNLQNDLNTEDLDLKFNQDSKKEEWWLAESSISEIRKSQTLQIERIGFFICDGPFEFNLIPFTKQKRTE